MYPDWIREKVDAFNREILEGDFKKGRLLKVKMHTERQPRELSTEKEKFDLIKRLLLEENILMEVEYGFRKIDISFTKKV